MRLSISMLNLGSCEFWASYGAKISCILVYDALNHDFSSKKVLFAFIKYDSHIKGKLRTLNLICCTPSHPLSNGLKLWL
jgi:hypothetical protein